MDMLYIVQLMGLWVVSRFSLFWKVLSEHSWTILIIDMILFLLSKYLRVQLLGCGVGVMFNFIGPHQAGFQDAFTILPHTSNLRKDCFLFTSILHCQTFKFWSSSVCTVCIYVCVLSCVWCFVTPWTVACQAPLSMEFSRQEYWSGLPSPTPGDLPDPGMEPESPASPPLAGWLDSFPLCHLGSPTVV